MKFIYISSLSTTSFISARCQCCKIKLCFIYVFFLLQFRLGMIHMWWPWKLSNFQDPPPHLSIYVQNSFTPVTLDVQFQMNPLSPNDNQSIKRTHNPRMTIYVVRSFLQVGFRFQCHLIHLVCLSFDLFSFNWTVTTCFFVALYSCVCSCPKISWNVFYL